jgi:hypothetical protein
MAPEYKQDFFEISSLREPQIVKQLGLSPAHYRIFFGIPSEVIIPHEHASLLLLEPVGYSESEPDYDRFKVEKGDIPGRVSVRPSGANIPGMFMPSLEIGNYISVSAADAIGGIDLHVTTRIKRANVDNKGFEHLMAWHNNTGTFETMKTGDEFITKSGVVLVPLLRGFEGEIVYILPISEFTDEGEGVQKIRDILTQ